MPDENFSINVGVNGFSRRHSPNEPTRLCPGCKKTLVLSDFGWTEEK